MIGRDRASARHVPQAVRLLGRVAFVLIAGTGLLASEAPARVEGLVAWYRIDSLHGNHNDGDFVTAWPDSSAGGHDLSAESGGVKALFETRRLNGEPVVAIRGRTVFRLAQPLVLSDHTVFLVLDSKSSRRGLFFDDSDDRNGLILYDDGGIHRYHASDPERLAPYNEKPIPGREFGITVLRRSHGVLGCAVNGVDHGSGVQFEDTVRIGGFFSARTTRDLRIDGDGLRIAELIFYDRGLSDAETSEVTAYLSGKYGIAVLERRPAVRTPAPAQSFLPPRQETGAWLASRFDGDVNDGAVVVPWDRAVKLEPPFDHDPDHDNSKLVCARDGTRAELFVQIPVRTSARGTRVRLLILKNGEEYLEQQGDSGTITGKNPKSAMVRLRTTLTMQAGDYLEVVATGFGDPGVVVIEPAGAAFVLRGE